MYPNRSGGLNAYMSEGPIGADDAGNGWMDMRGAFENIPDLKHGGVGWANIN